MSVVLRPWRESDAAACAALANDEGVAENLRDVFPHPYTEADARAFIALCLAADPRDALFCAVEADGRFAGGISLTRGTDVARQSAELGYWLGRPFWGRGVATEAVRQMCARGFAAWGLARIFAEPFSRNRASCRVLEKNGFAHEGVKRQSVVKRGVLLDSELYARTGESDPPAPRGYTRVDLAGWPRRAHYRYYTETLRVDYNVTVPLRVEALLDDCHRRGRRFYPAFLALTSAVVNRTEAFRMFRDAAGDLCLWDTVCPNYTIFHEDDHTFSDCWSAYSPDPETMYRTIVADMAQYGRNKGIKARPGQPPNFFCISCAPWLPFTAYGSRVADGAPQLFPVLTAGRYERDGQAVRLPLNLLIAHAVCDGWHAGQFFEDLQRAIDALAQQ